MVAITRDEAKQTALWLLGRVREFRSILRHGGDESARDAAHEDWDSYCRYARLYRGTGSQIYRERRLGER